MTAAEGFEPKVNGAATGVLISSAEIAAGVRDGVGYRLENASIDTGD